MTPIALDRKISLAFLFLLVGNSALIFKLSDDTTIQASETCRDNSLILLKFRASRQRHRSHDWTLTLPAGYLW